MKATIRQMNVTDIDSVYAIETSVHVVPWSKDILRDCVLAGFNCQVLDLVCENNQSVIVGYIIARVSDATCHILNFGIADSFQLKGWGRKLLEYFLSLLSEHDVKSAVLEVRPSNQIALHLYKSMDFKVIEIKKAYYNDKHGVEDAMSLKKEI